MTRRATRTDLVHKRRHLVQQAAAVPDEQKASQQASPPYSQAPLPGVHCENSERGPSISHKANGLRTPLRSIASSRAQSRPAISHTFCAHCAITPNESRSQSAENRPDSVPDVQSWGVRRADRRSALLLTILRCRSRPTRRSQLELVEQVELA